MKTIHFYSIAKDGDVFVADDAFLEHAAKSMKVEKLTAEELATLGEVTQHSVTLKPAKFGLKKAITASAQVDDALLGRRVDETLLPTARAVNVVESWSFGKVDADTFNDLDISVAEHIDDRIVSHLYPDLGRDKDFFLALSGKSKSSVDKPPDKA